jgi:hypothetical protein
MRKYYLGVFMSRYYFSSHIAWQIEKVNNQVYVLDRVNNATYLFSKVSRDIWKMISFKLTVDDMSEFIAERYHIDRSLACKDIKAFIESLQNEGLIYEE